MSALKKYVKMFLTAMICFAMCLIPGKKAKEVVKKTQACGQTVALGKENGMVCSERGKNALFSAEKHGVGQKLQKREEGVKKANIRCLGPGDRKKRYAIRQKLLLMT